MITASDLATSKMQAYYVAAHHYIKTKKKTYKLWQNLPKDYVNIQ